MALALNVGHMMDTRVQLQTAYDSAALAGVRELNGSITRFTAARTSARAFATGHDLDKNTIELGLNSGNLPTGDIVLGHWSRTANRFYSDGESLTVCGNPVTLNPPAGSYLYNAVRIRGGADGESGHNTPVDVYFGAFLGNRSTFRVRANALAVGGGPCADKCPLPVVIPACQVVDLNNVVRCNQRIVARFGANELAFTNFRGQEGRDADGQPYPVDNYVHTSEVAEAARAARSCWGARRSMCERINTNDANYFSSVRSSQIPLDDQDPVYRWDTVLEPFRNNDPADGSRAIMCPLGTPLENCPRHRLPVLDIFTCPSGSLNNSKRKIVGFMNVVVTCAQSNATPEAEKCRGGEGALLEFYVDCATNSSDPGGCPVFGYAADRKNVRLVQ